MTFRSKGPARDDGAPKPRIRVVKPPSTSELLDEHYRKHGEPGRTSGSWLPRLPAADRQRPKRGE